MHISIIVPVYNVEKYLRRCVDSILMQTYSDWELVLVDDGSPDRCPQICDEYASTDKRIKVIHKENGGLSDARNCGLKVATGEYVLFVDSDDFIHHDMLKDMAAWCIKEDVDIVQCSYIRGTCDNFPLIRAKSSKAHLFDNHSIFSSSRQQTILCAKLYRKGLWEDIHMPVGKIHEDDATTWKLYYRSQKIVVLDTPYYYYYKNPQGIMAKESRRFNAVIVEAYDERIRFFKDRGENLLVTLSQWCFCQPLIYLFVRGSLTREENNYLLRLLRDNLGDVIRCRLVPWSHRLLFLIFSLCPRGLRCLSVMLGKAHNIQ